MAWLESLMSHTTNRPRPPFDDGDEFMDDATWAGRVARLRSSRARAAPPKAAVAAPAVALELEDLPERYLAFLAADEIARVSRLLSRSAFGVDAPKVRALAASRDVDVGGGGGDLAASRDVGDSNNDLLRRLAAAERAAIWEPFSSPRWRRRWADGPTVPGDACRDPAPPGAPLAAPRPWACDAAIEPGRGLVLRGGGEMNFTGVHRRVDARPRRVACRVRTARRSPRRGFFNVCFSSGEAPHRALRFFHVGHADVFSVLVPLNEAHDRIQLWLPSARYPIFVAAPGAGDEVALELRLEWDDAGALAGDGRPCLWLGARVDGKDAAGPCAVRLPDDGSYDGFRHCYLFSWVQDDDRGAAADAEASIRDLVVEERGVDDAFLADVRAEIGRREACARRGDDVEAVLRTLGLPADPRGDPPPVVVDGDPLGTALGDPGRLDDAEEDWTAGEFGDSDSGASGSEAGSLHGGAVA